MANITFKELRELGYEKLADIAVERSKGQAKWHGENNDINFGITWVNTDEGHDFWERVNSSRFEEAKEMFPDYFTQTKSVEDLIDENSDAFTNIVASVEDVDYDTLLELAKEGAKAMHKILQEND